MEPERKPKTRRGKKALEDRQPKVFENSKSLLYMMGLKCPEVLQDLMRDWNSMTKPQSRVFARKRDLHPMEDETPFERLSKKLDISLFVCGTSTKKRPFNLTFVRMFDHHLLDMCELGLTDYKLLEEFKGVMKPGAENKACLIFQGAGWDHHADYSNVRSMLQDVFRGPNITNIFLGGIDRVIIFSLEEPHIKMQHYRIIFKKSGTRLPLVKLEECGPMAMLKLGRTRWAAKELMSEAMKVPEEAKPVKVKNVSRNQLGDKVGKVHMQRQEFDKLQTRKMKGLKRNIKVDDKRFEDRDGEPSAKKEAKTNGHATAEDMDF